MKVKKGQWYYLCCHLDLYQADEDFEEDDDDTIISGVFDTKEEAVKNIVAMWEGSNCPEQAQEALELLK